MRRTILSDTGQRLAYGHGPTSLAFVRCPFSYEVTKSGLADGNCALHFVSSRRRRRNYRSQPARQFLSPLTGAIPGWQNRGPVVRSTANTTKPVDEQSTSGANFMSGVSAIGSEKMKSDCVRNGPAHDSILRSRNGRGLGHVNKVERLPNDQRESAFCESWMGSERLTRLRICGHGVCACRQSCWRRGGSIPPARSKFTEQALCWLSGVAASTAGSTSAQTSGILERASRNGYPHVRIRRFESGAGRVNSRRVLPPERRGRLHHSANRDQGVKL